MRKVLAVVTVILITVFITNNTWASEKDSINQTENDKTEKALKVVPLITSSPLMGLGVGFAGSYLYQLDGDLSSKSQLQIGGQYSNTHSYNLFLKNNAWLKNNSIRITTNALYSNVNNQFQSDGASVDYEVTSAALQQIFMFRVGKNLYIGSPLSYASISYKPNNEHGRDFLEKNGIRNEQTYGAGLGVDYDNRKNKYYPINATWAKATFSSYVGSFDIYHHLITDVRHYFQGFNEEDVFAVQFLGIYASKYTPDSGLPSLNGSTQLRGFPNGKYKARHQSGFQGEYRYTIKNTRFRVTSFVGVANLNGGSAGFDGKSRNDDGWYSAAGIGLRYKLQPITGVDLRLDFTRNSDGESAIYLMINQAF